MISGQMILGFLYDHTVERTGHQFGGESDMDRTVVPEHCKVAAMMAGRYWVYHMGLGQTELPVTTVNTKKERLPA